MQTAMKNGSEKAPHTTIAEQTAAIEALESSIDDALERDPKLKYSLIMRAARAHLRGLKELRAEQIADEADARKRQEGNETGTNQHNH